MPSDPTRPSGVDACADDESGPQELVVRVGDTDYGIPLDQVREVVRTERVTRVPGAPPVVRGIINVRGAIVTVLDLSVLLRATRAIEGPSVVLLEHGSRLVGLAVDAVRDVRAPDAPTAVDGAQAGPASVIPLDAVAHCAPYLLSSEEMGS